MAELLGNDNNRREKLKEVIKSLHEGASVVDVKDRFKEVIDGITSTELASIENELIEEGLPMEEVKRLCDVHVSVFKESLESKKTPEQEPGHPVYVFKQENRAIEGIIDEIKSFIKNTGTTDEDSLSELRGKFNQLMDIDKHYLRKENLLFPLLEQKGFTGPSKVMWALHDDIRDEIKKIIASVDSGNIESELIGKTLDMVSDMIYKEEQVLYPAAVEKLIDKEWISMAKQSLDYGYTLFVPEKDWASTVGQDKTEEVTSVAGDKIRLSTGNFSLEQLELLFKNLPVDITFVDEEDRVRFFSEGPERIFHRSKAIIGRKVQNCHPPKSVHVVEKIVEEFKSNQRNVAEFWLQMGGKFIHIRYFALRDSKGKYKGTLEVSQDVTGIKKLEGNKRILDPL